MDETHGTGDVTLEDKGDQARFTATGRAAELLGTTDALRDTIEIDCRQVERYWIGRRRRRSPRYAASGSKIASIGRPNTFEIRKASGSDGSYLPVSIELTV